MNTPLRLSRHVLCPCQISRCLRPLLMPRIFSSDFFVRAVADSNTPRLKIHVGPAELAIIGVVVEKQRDSTSGYLGAEFRYPVGGC